MREHVKVRFPKVRFPERVWKKLMAYIHACPMEVGGLGTVRQDEEGHLVVEEVFLIEQDVTSVTTELDPAGLARFITEWVRQGRDPSALRFWWHSHADSGTAWSTVDTDTMDRLAGDGYLVSLVGNRRREHRARLTLRGVLPVDIDDIVAEVIEERDEVLELLAEEEVKEKVRRRGWNLFRRGPKIPEFSDDEGFLKGERG